MGKREGFNPFENGATGGAIAFVVARLIGLAIDVGMNKLNNYLLRWHRGLEN